MKVLVLSSGELKVQEIGNELEDLQKIVDGYIEIPFLSKKFFEEEFEEEIDVIINEEGKLIDGMKPEIAIVNEKQGNIVDIIYGNCIFASHDEEGNTVGLNEKQVEIVKNELETVIELMSKKNFETFDVRVLFI